MNAIKHPLILCILSAIFLSMAWYLPVIGSLSLCIAFVPLFYLSDRISDSGTRKKGLKVFLYTYFTFLLWNIFTTWWIYHASAGGAIAAFIANTLLMTIPFLAYHKCKKTLSKKVSLWAFVFFWLGFEYFHLNWQISWPWLTLGNGFALNPHWIQWYEYTGALGGSFWALLVNITFYKMTIARKSQQKNYLIYGISCLVLPILLSYIIYYNYEEKGQPFEVVVVQPNIDPYNEKFAGSKNFISFEQQINRLINLSKEKIDARTQLVAWPETAIDQAYEEGRAHQEPLIKKLKAWVDENDFSLLTGITSIKIYPRQEDASPTARYHETVGYYDVFNTGLWINQGIDSIQFYHKSKLVPGVETLPYPMVFKFLAGWIIDLGGTSGGMGRQKERSVFFKDQTGIAPVICYESVFGEFVGDYVKNGANLICIITNDGWWGNTPGYKQHLSYATLRAIETRKSIARSANTGISCFINQKGDISEATKYWEQDVRKGTLLSNDFHTFYTRYGDYIGRISGFLAVGLLLSALIRRIIP